MLYDVLHSLLPQIIRGSRKALIWFGSASTVSLLEVVKALGPVLNWTQVQQDWWGHEALLLQALVVSMAALWTQQIAKEDAALKLTMLPPAPVPAPPFDLFPAQTKRSAGRVAPEQ